MNERIIDLNDNDYQLDFYLMRNFFRIPPKNLYNAFIQDEFFYDIP